MYTRTLSYALDGLQVHPVDVEVDTGRGLPTIVMVGLPGKAVMESKDRVRTAISNSGHPFPRSKVTVNLAPGDLRKDGPTFDLPIALGILLCGEGLKPSVDISTFRVVGELTLDGRCRPVPGVLSLGEACAKEGKSFVCPAANHWEARLVEGLKVIPISHLDELVAHFQGELSIETLMERAEQKHPNQHQESFHPLDFADVAGQSAAKRALTIAAAGRHNLLMVGPPGSGKSMLAERFPTLLPSLAGPEALEVTKIHSIAGQLQGGLGLMRERPFRAPHHTISDAALIGGGSDARPGEISLSHLGVLFLDELPEFRRSTLEVLRQPLESGQVNIGRVQKKTEYPANFQLIAAMNPCPCGYYGARNKPCRCTGQQVERYLSKLSGPLLDRIDLHVEVNVPNPPSLRQQKRSGPTSAELQERVKGAVARQEHRYRDVARHRNGDLRGPEVERYCPLDQEGETLLVRGMEEMGLSTRAFHKIQIVARTIADLDDSENITSDHLSEAIGYRVLDQHLFS